MKNYYIMLSKHYPATHPRKGDPTNFEDKYLDGSKGHTIRGNYAFWKKRIDQVNDGKACLQLRQWSGKPYCSKMVTIAIIYSGLSYQMINIRQKYSGLLKKKLLFIEVDEIPLIGCVETTIIKNDGLTEEDFKAWFKKDLIGGIIIHWAGLEYR